MLCKIEFRKMAERQYLGDLLYMSAKGFYSEFRLDPFSEYRRKLRNPVTSREEVETNINNMINLFLKR